MTVLQEISTTDLHNLQKKKPGIHLIDVRTEEEFNEGHAKDAINRPLGTIAASRIGEELGLSPTEPIYLICRSGGRSAKAGEAFLEAGFSNVYNVVGGTLDWLEKGLPTSPKD